ncbi:MAG: peptidylprolyl isomerase [Acidobacteria bacterium]|nr:peptidylprolyl isomerase [Acidobacteriota bacterium]
MPCLAASTLAAQAPAFTAKEAVLAEWNRHLPAMGADQLAKLPTSDRARYELALARIGAPGAPDLLPPELAHPTKELWEELARKAKTPEERFNALYFLNRFKAPDALAALDGLTAADAKSWPAHLHLEAQIATARIHGGEVSAELKGFLNALQEVGKVDPVRAQAARIRLITAGIEQRLLPLLDATPDAILSTMDAWNQKPWASRKDDHLALWWAAASLIVPPPPGKDRNPISLSQLGLQPSLLPNQAQKWALWSRIWDGLPESGRSLNADQWPIAMPPSNRTIQVHFYSKLPLIADVAKDAGPNAVYLDRPTDPMLAAAYLPALRQASPKDADALRDRMIASDSPVARAAAIDDLPEAPADLDALAKRCFHDTDLESTLELFAALNRWKLSEERQKAVLTPFLQHPDWGWRYQAYLQLKKVDPATAWPSAPPQRPMDKALLDEAVKFAERGKPVRLRLTFSGKRVVTLKLDPTVAPINVANLVLLAKKRFFDGHRVPRVVPDFVVQMGSPYDTMDGGPGYSVRCEDSTTWYGPGSVGMALAGKDTGGCQFFITTNATPHLTGKYTRVGEVEHPDHDLKILDDMELGAKIESVRVLE